VSDLRVLFSLDLGFTVAVVEALAECSDDCGSPDSSS